MKKFAITSLIISVCGMVFLIGFEFGTSTSTKPYQNDIKKLIELSVYVSSFTDDELTNIIDNVVLELETARVILQKGE